MRPAEKKHTLKLFPPLRIMQKQPRLQSKYARKERRKTVRSSKKAGEVSSNTVRQCSDIKVRSCKVVVNPTFFLPKPTPQRGRSPETKPATLSHLLRGPRRGVWSGRARFQPWQHGPAYTGEGRAHPGRVVIPVTPRPFPRVWTPRTALNHGCPASVTGRRAGKAAQEAERLAGAAVVTRGAATLPAGPCLERAGALLRRGILTAVPTLRSPCCGVPPAQRDCHLPSTQRPPITEDGPCPTRRPDVP